jgi:hypothetical protein
VDSQGEEHHNEDERKTKMQNSEEWKPDCHLVRIFSARATWLHVYCI